MKAIIILNGEGYKKEINTTGGFVICCDGGLSYCKRKNIKPDLTVGDFDSYKGRPPANSVKYPAQKNMSDGEIAIDILIEKNIKEAEIYCGGGKRDDHFLFNLHLLIKALKNGINAKMITNFSEIYAADKKFCLTVIKGRTVSLAPFSEIVHINNCTGLKYNVPKILRHGETVSLSNIAVSDNAEIDIASGVLLIFIINA